MPSPHDPREIWNRRYASLDQAAWGDYEPWLEAAIAMVPPGLPRTALDLGCGIGMDTRYLIESGFSVTAADLSKEALSICGQRNPDATPLLLDLRNGINFEMPPLGLVVANLSLHYFDRDQTHRIFADIHRNLDTGGILAVRLNALGDENFGSPESDGSWMLHTVEGVEKQFFTVAKIREVTGSRFRIRSLELLETARFGRAKRLWQCVCEKCAPLSSRL